MVYERSDCGSTKSLHSLKVYVSGFGLLCFTLEHKQIILLLHFPCGGSQTVRYCRVSAQLVLAAETNPFIFKLQRGTTGQPLMKRAYIFHISVSQETVLKHGSSDSIRGVQDVLGGTNWKKAVCFLLLSLVVSILVSTIHAFCGFSLTASSKVWLQRSQSHGVQWDLPVNLS